MVYGKKMTREEQIAALVLEAQYWRRNGYGGRADQLQVLIDKMLEKYVKDFK